MAMVRGVWVRLALLASLLVPVWFLVAALGTKFGLFPWTFGFGVMSGAKVVQPMLLGTAAFALIGLALALAVPPRRGRRAAFVALLIPVLGLGYAVYMRQTATALPPVHEASTDWADPPSFSQTVLEARAKLPGANALDLDAPLPATSIWPQYAHRRTLDVLRETQADLKPMVTDTPAFDAFQVALDTAEAQPGWVVDRNDATTGVIEAHATSFWYGFTDDIAIRVRRLPDDSGTTIDIRSVSRVGLSDLGANAMRVRAYLASLNAKLGEAATGG